MAFSPDSTKLAVAQSDNIVFVYRLGLEWGEKKSICNKFQQSASITAMVWPNGRDQELVFATADGKVRPANTQRLHCQYLYHSCVKPVPYRSAVMDF